MKRKRSRKRKPVIEFHCPGFEEMPRKTQSAILEMVRAAHKMTTPTNDLRKGE